MIIRQRKRRVDSAKPNRLMHPLMAQAMLVALLSLTICGVLQAGVDVPNLNTSEPVVFRGEIAQGLKIEMALYRDGSTLHGTYMYEAFGRDIQVKGTITEEGEVALHESVKGKETGKFQGKFVSKDRLEGKWYRPGSDKGRAFFLVSSAAAAPRQAAKEDAAVPLPAKQAAATAAKPRLTLATAPAPKPAVQPVALSTAQPVKQETAPVTRELPPVQPDKKIEAAAVPVERVPVSPPVQPEKKIEAAAAPAERVPVTPPQAQAVETPKAPVQEQTLNANAVSQEPAKLAVAESEARPAEKPRVEGRALGSKAKKSKASWTDQVFNMRVIGGFGGLLILGVGLAWVAVVAGGAAGFRDSSALFRQAHALGLSFLPGVFLLALGVGAVLATFVE